MADDGYVQWYTAKLWAMLPAIYRMLDAAGASDGSGLPDSSSAALPPGPLQEMVARIGSQAAVLRRSIDRLWDNQSIETCDDWVIPYIGDLLATRIVSCLDARSQRIDVAKTIYYRRRSGTLGLIEELASDIAGHDARAVEFFRRLGRTRHNFDPPIGLVPGLSAYPTAVALLAGPPPAAVIEGLAGAYSRTPAGGYADLRNAYGAANAGSAFDELAYIADFRAGRQSTGWYNIPRLGIFIWWLYGYPITEATPVERTGCPGQYSFDPTGRDMPLFAPSSRSSEDFGETWVSPDEWKLPVALRQVLWNLLPDTLYPAAFNIALLDISGATIQPADQFVIDVERGQFRFVGPPSLDPVTVNYTFGFSSPVGAGGHDPRIFATTMPVPATTVSVVRGQSLDTLLGAVTSDTDFAFADSATYPGPTIDPGTNAPAPANLAFTAAAGERPVLRWTTPGAWTITGAGEGTLVLQGLWLQGADLVIAGHWDRVALRLCTIDPGSADPATPGGFLTAIDGVALAPGHIFIEGQIALLTLENCITGAIRTRQGGAIETLSASDSIIQSIATHAPDATPVLYDAADLAARLRVPGNAAAAPIVAALSPADNALLQGYAPGTPVPPALVAALQAAVAGQPPAALETAFPLAFADLAIGGASGDVALVRTTVLGPIQVHRLSASETILDQIAMVDDPQEGCVRFSTLAAGHNLHAPYRCATVAPVAEILESRRFGQPAYARVRADADDAILPGALTQPPPTVVYGAQNGAQPGAFAAEQQALTQRGLAQKLEEYSPIGVTPVWVDAHLPERTADAH